MSSEFTVSGEDLWQWWVSVQQPTIEAGVDLQELDRFLNDLTGLDRLTLRLEVFRQQPVIFLQVPFETLKTRWQQRLSARIPVQYLTGVSPWREFILRVSSAVLIPRPETEYLIDLAKQAVIASPVAARLAMGYWVDVGTGSGAIAMGLATVFPQAQIHAVDISPAALVVACENAKRYQLLERIKFYTGSWFQPLTTLKGQVSGVVSNPPYIPTAEVAHLQPEVFQHEPHLALDGGLDGLDAIRHLIAGATEYLVPGGIWLVEAMAGQATEIVRLLQQQGSYANIQVYSDLAGIDRFVLAIRV